MERRNDVNKQFQELTEVLKQIEREAQEMGRGDDSYGSLSTMMAIAASTGPTNRVDLIARTIVHLERLNRTAKKQKIEINQLREQLESTKKSGEDMAEKLKDVMFNQQRHVMSGFSPYPHMMSSVQQQGTTNNTGAVTCGGTIPGTQQVGMRSVATNGTTTTTNGAQHHQQQQIPMMMMPMMMPPPAATTSTSNNGQQQVSPTNVPGAAAPTSTSGGGAPQQQQPQQQYMMMVPPQMAMGMGQQSGGQPMMQPMLPHPAMHQQQQQQPQQAQQQQQVVQQQQQPQQQQQVVQQQPPQQQTYVQQQPQQQQQTVMAPTTASPTDQCNGAGAGAGAGGGVDNTGENFAHAT